MKAKKYTIEDMQQLAAEQGGKCLSLEYKHSLSVLLWQCEKGHVWEAHLSDLRNGKWCPACGSGMGRTVKNMGSSTFNGIVASLVKTDETFQDWNKRVNVREYKKNVALRLKIAQMEYDNGGSRSYPSFFYVMIARNDPRIQNTVIATRLKSVAPQYACVECGRVSLNKLLDRCPHCGGKIPNHD